jgi:hypothetical protein
MKTLEEQKASKCVHFNGLQNDKCEAGILYVAVENLTVKGFARWPCFRDGEACQCSRRHFPTPEEVAAGCAATRASMARTGKAMDAAFADAKAKGFEKGNGGSGQVKCPCCDSGTLHYSVAAYNGHVWGKCSTDGCVSWMM